MRRFWYLFCVWYVVNLTVYGCIADHSKTLYYRTILELHLQCFMIFPCNHTFVSELGHNFDSEHDPGSEGAECSPGNYKGGNYLMYPASVRGQQPKNKLCKNSAIWYCSILVSLLFWRDYIPGALEKRITFWLQRTRSLPCAFVFTAFAGDIKHHNQIIGSKHTARLQVFDSSWWRETRAN